MRGVLETDALLSLIAESSALLFGSKYEGFGLPPLEAALVGTPVVYRRIPAVAEVMGDTHFPFESSYDSFKRALDAALAATQEHIAHDGASLAGRFRWADVAQRTLTTYREVL